MGDQKFYTKGEREYARVTSILKTKSSYPLMLWYGKHGTTWCKAESKRTRDQGNLAHDVLEEYFTGRKVIPDAQRALIHPAMTKAVERAKAWALSVKLDFQPDDVERTVYHDEFGYAGTIDMVGKIFGRPAIIDWKFGKGTYDDYAMQTSAYYEALKYELKQDMLWDRWTLRFGIDDDSFEVTHWDELAKKNPKLSHSTCWLGFRGLAMAYFATEKNIKIPFIFQEVPL